MVKIYGANNVFIATSNKTGPGSPFNFEQKKQMMMMTGVPASAIVECRVPYQPKEILQNYDENTTVLKFAVGAKDMDEDPRFKFGNKRDGSPSYLQDADAHRGNFQPFKKHGYVVTAPTLSFKVLGSTVQSATKLRALYQTLDDKKSDQFIIDLFGNTDPNFKQMLDTALMRNDQEQVAESDLVTDRNNMREIVKQMLTDYIEQEDDIEKLNFLVKQIIHKEIKKRGTKYQISDENINEQELPVAQKIKPLKMPTPPKAPDATIPRTRNGHTTDDGITYKQDKYDENIMHVETGSGDYTFDGSRIIKWITPRINGYRQIHDFVQSTIKVDADTTVKTKEGGEVVLSTNAVYDLEGNLKNAGELGVSSGGVSVSVGDKIKMNYTISDNLSIHIKATRKTKPSDKQIQAYQTQLKKAKSGSLQTLIDLANMSRKIGASVTFKSPANQGAIPFNQGIEMLKQAGM